MEARSRRLAVLASHLRSLPYSSTSFRCLASASCSGSSSSVDLETSAPDCVFCKIVRGQGEAFVLYQDDVCLCFLDLNPLSHGHSLVIPRSHFSSLATTPPSVVAAMCSKIPYLSNAIMKATGAEAFNLVVNNGAAAGQVVFHTHIHIIPRKRKDCLWNSESIQRHSSLLLDDKASRLVDSVREHLTFADREEQEEEDGASKSS